MKTCYCSRRVCTKNRAWCWNGLEIGTFLNVVSNQGKLCCWKIAGFISFPKVKIAKFSEHMFFRFGLSFVFLCAALSAEKSLILFVISTERTLMLCFMLIKYISIVRFRNNAKKLKAHYNSCTTEPRGFHV